MASKEVLGVGLFLSSPFCWVIIAASECVRTTYLCIPLPHLSRAWQRQHWPCLSQHMGAGLGSRPTCVPSIRQLTGFQWSRLHYGTPSLESSVAWHEFLTSWYSQEARRSCRKRLRQIFKFLAAWNDSMTSCIFEASVLTKALWILSVIYNPSQNICTLCYFYRLDLFFNVVLFFYYCALGRCIFSLGHQGQHPWLLLAVITPPATSCHLYPPWACISILTGKFTK